MVTGNDNNHRATRVICSPVVVIVATSLSVGAYAPPPAHRTFERKCADQWEHNTASGDVPDGRVRRAPPAANVPVGGAVSPNATASEPRPLSPSAVISDTTRCACATAARIYATQHQILRRPGATTVQRAQSPRDT